MNKRVRPRFSVVIPCYNEANFIADTLRSLKNQTTDESFEIIVVDNNCTDESASIAQSYGARVVYEKNPGVCWARQTGTKEAKGEIIISTDADTQFSSDWLEKIDSTFKNNDKILAVGGPCRYYDGPWWGSFYTHFLFSGSYLYQFISGHPFYITATNFAFKKSAWDSYEVNQMQGGDELGLLHDLKKKGKVSFNNTNPTYTSGRRLTKGLTYNIFVTFIYYYFGAYYLNKIFKRTVIGAAPAFRVDKSGGLMDSINYLIISFSMLLFLAVLNSVPIRSFITDNFSDGIIVIRDDVRNNL